MTHRLGDIIDSTPMTVATPAEGYHLIYNDYSYAKVFSRHVANLAREHDVLVGMSTSGNSPSIIEAIHSAKRHGIKTIALLGRDGGNARGMADVEIIVPVKSTARIQEAHKFVIHAFCRLLEKRLFG